MVTIDEIRILLKESLAPIIQKLDGIISRLARMERDALQHNSSVALLERLQPVPNMERYLPEFLETKNYPIIVGG